MLRALLKRHIRDGSQTAAATGIPGIRRVYAEGEKDVHDVCFRVFPAADLFEVGVIIDSSPASAG